MKPGVLARSPLRHLPSAQQRLIVHGVILLLTFGVAQRWVLQPVEHRQRTLQRDLDTATQRTTILRSLEGTQRSLGKIRRRLPSRGDSSALVQQLATLAATHHLTIDAVTPQSTSAVGRYTRFPIRVEATGTFADVTQFLYALQTGTTPFRCDHLDVAIASETWGPGAPKASPTSAAQLRMQLTASTLLREG